VYQYNYLILQLLLGTIKKEDLKIIEKEVEKEL
jgi:hypothetical protein